MLTTASAAMLALRSGPLPASYFDRALLRALILFHRVNVSGLDMVSLAPTAEPAPTHSSADALAASLWAAGEAAGDPWRLTAGVPSGAGAAPLTGPAYEVES